MCVCVCACVCVCVCVCVFIAAHDALFPTSVPKTKDTLNSAQQFVLVGSFKTFSIFDNVCIITYPTPHVPLKIVLFELG